MISALEPSEAQLAAFARADQTQPVAMLNLLKFRDKAEYTDGRDAKGMSGQDAYGLYGLVAMQKIAEVGGRMFWAAPGPATFIGGENDDWDMVVIIRYPSRAAFLEMINKPDYREAIPHRDAGLLRTALLDCPGGSIPA
ncbi:MAG: DUF1330 domain-containing protein [Parvibaculum sp.]|uniref:DUF1330 domain-containing protein n=1 Tax=Parvibaculum sp. TaxID=2024848 RepID=UPI0025CC1552|nr:DUF1330 domain-containing protein [Parvibaculum sp.]MCE9650924.1 DUF1330 domain-containing protein [Parvibaculum sp.]